MNAGRRLFLWTLIVSLCLTAALAIGTLLFADFDDRAGRILLTTTFLSVASLLALPAGVLLDQGRGRLLGWATIALSAAGFVAAMVAVWAAEDDDRAWKVALTIGLAAVVGAQASASSVRRRPTDGGWLKGLYVGGILLSLLLAALIAFAAWEEVEDNAGFYRFLGATAVAAVLATLLQPLARRLEGPPARARRLVLELDREPSDEAVAAAIEALAQHGVGAQVAGRQQV
jgi:MFS family permease